MANELKLVSDEPGYSVTASDFDAETVAPQTAVQAAPETHPLDDAVDAYAKLVKDVRLKKVELNAAIAEQEKAALEVSGLNAELGKLAGDEQAAFEKVQTEREAADLPKALPKSDDSE